MLYKIWSVISSKSAMAILAIFSIGFSVYQSLFFERSGEIIFSLDPPAKVFDIHRPVGGLEISYSGENLRDSKKTLWIVNATLQNNGNAVIKKGDFDSKAPLGLTIGEGEIVDTPSLRSNNEYLKDNFQATISGPKLIFTPTILEPADTVYISFLVLGPENTSPTIRALGKIAGLKSLPIVTTETEKNNSIWLQVFYADRWWIQVIRTFVYAIGLVVSMMLIVALGVAISAPISSMKNRKNKQELQNKLTNYRQGEDLSAETRALHLFILDHGVFRLGFLKDHLTVLLLNARKRENKLSHPDGFDGIPAILHIDSQERKRFIRELQAYGLKIEYNPIFLKRIIDEIIAIETHLGIDQKEAEIRRRKHLDLISAT